MRNLKMSLSFLAICFIILYFGLYFNTPGFIVKSEMQKFIDKEYDSKFKIINIKRNYSPDFLHHVSGYEIELEDKNEIRFSNIFLQKNEVSDKWETYQGTNLEYEYSIAKSNSNKS
jgi:hypothetical protein